MFFRVEFFFESAHPFANNGIQFGRSDMDFLEQNHHDMCAPNQMISIINKLTNHINDLCFFLFFFPPFFSPEKIVGELHTEKIVYMPLTFFLAFQKCWWVSSTAFPNSSPTLYNLCVGEEIPECRWSPAPRFSRFVLSTHFSGIIFFLGFFQLGLCFMPHLNGFFKVHIWHLPNY